MKYRFLLCKFFVKKQYLLSITFAFAMPLLSYGQVAIDDVIDSTAVLKLGRDPGGAYRGLIIPRFGADEINETWKTFGPTPAMSLLVYDSTNSFYSFYSQKLNDWQILNPWVGKYQGSGSYQTELIYTDPDTQVGIGTETVNNGTRLQVTGRVEADVYKGEFTVPAGGIIMFSGTYNDKFAANGCGRDNTEYKGWALCNGSNGTPNLRGRFIAGYDPAQTDYNTIGNTGGQDDVALTKNQLPTHTHSARAADGATINITNSGDHTHDVAYNVPNGNTGNLNNNKSSAWQANFDASRSATTTSDGHTHASSSFQGKVSDGGEDGLVGAAHENRPSFYVLAFIMKLAEGANCPN